MQPPILISSDDDVTRIIFNRPNQYNAIDLDFARAMAECAALIESGNKSRAIAIEAKGKVFCAGGDIRYFSNQKEDLIDVVTEILDCFHKFILAIYRSHLPVIVGVQGSAGGAGLSLILACDYCLAASSAQFSFGYSRLGVSPDGGATWFLPRLVGSVRAKNLLLTSGRISALEALDLGLVSSICSAECFPMEFAKQVGKFSALSSNGTRETLKLLRRDNADLEGHLEQEKKSFLQCAKTDDFKEGVAAFLERRIPAFT